MGASLSDVVLQILSFIAGNDGKISGRDSEKALKRQSDLAVTYFIGGRENTRLS